MLKIYVELVCGRPLYNREFVELGKEPKGDTNPRSSKHAVSVYLITPSKSC
jgi:hypothetical protein